MDDNSKRPDVASRVNFFSCKKFRGSICPCTCGSLECAIRICVGKTEVNYLDVLAIIGYHYVLRLEISVDYLFFVDILEGITYFANNLFR